MNDAYTITATVPAGGPTDITLPDWPETNQLDIVQLDNADELWVRVDGQPAAVDGDHSYCSPGNAQELRIPVTGSLVRQAVDANADALVVSVVYPTGGRVQFSAVRP